MSSSTPSEIFLSSYNNSTTHTDTALASSNHIDTVSPCTTFYNNNTNTVSSYNTCNTTYNTHTDTALFSSNNIDTVSSYSVDTLPSPNTPNNTYNNTETNIDPNKSPPLLLQRSLFSLVLSYGIVKITQQLCQEMRYAVFTTVTQKAINDMHLFFFSRLIEKKSYHSFHSMMLRDDQDPVPDPNNSNNNNKSNNNNNNKSNSNKNKESSSSKVSSSSSSSGSSSSSSSTGIGALVKKYDRGLRGMSTFVVVLLFNLIPTVLEFCFVGYMMSSAASFGGSASFSLTLLITIVVYIYYTYRLTEYRKTLHIKLNHYETQCSERLLDCLLNY